MNYKKHLMEIQVEATGNRTFNLDYSLTKHLLKRMDQRAISREMLSIALLYGKCFFKQGLSYYYTMAKDLPESLRPSLRGKMDNMVLVVDDNESCVLTAYRSRKGLLHIKKKRKSLYKYAA